MDERITNGYREEREVAHPYRVGYLNSVKGYLQKLRGEADEKREAFVTPEKMAADPDGYRAKYMEMLGRPLTEYDKYKDVPVTLLEDTYVGEDELCTLRRMRLDVGEGLVMYGILYIPKPDIKAQTDKNLFVLYQHGGAGTPEMSGAFQGENNYNYAPRRIVARGATVFSPQLLLWNEDGADDKYNRAAIDVQLKQVGSSITAVEVFGVRRCFDYFEKQPYCDPEHIGMAGLSYGGFFSTATAACDKRIRSAYASCCLFDKLSLAWVSIQGVDINIMDMSWRDSGNMFRDSDVAGLVAPRAICFDAGNSDELFGSASAVEEFKRIKAYFTAQGAADKTWLKTFDGVHETDKEDDCIDFLFNHL